MKTIALLGLLLLGPVEQRTIHPSTYNPEVYICMTKNAYAYHLYNECRGLDRCKGTVKTVTRSEAIKKYGRKLCGWED